MGCGNSRTASLNETTPTNSTNENPIQKDTIEVVEPEIDKEKLRRDSLTQVYKVELYKENQTKANRLTTFYILAQQKFYNAEYEEALFLINRALNVKETADVLALKGSIYYGLGSTENFITYWKRALKLDKDLPMPPSPTIVQELKKYGLINENPDRNFNNN
tara:strand:+ start:11684 stop:12169 length:486 start_codon:yes stop_codon:yes gene_type:complete